MMLYVLCEGVRLVFEEGFEMCFEWYWYYEVVLVVGIKVMGLRLFGDDSCKMFVVICVEISGGIDGEFVCDMLLV